MNEKKKTITIFSTKMVQVEEGLFDKNAKEVDRAKTGEFLEPYFSRTINVTRMLESMVQTEAGKTRLLGLFQNKINQVKGGKDKADAAAIKTLVGMRTMNDMEFIKKYPVVGADEKVEMLFGVNIKDELNNPSDMNLSRRVERWGLRDEVIKLNKDSEEWKKVQRKSTVYQIGESNVYALHCLDEEDMDREKKAWLPCLLNCAFALAGRPAGGLKIQLVMHDAEFGRDTEYAKHDVMLLEDKAAVESEFEVVNGMLGENDDCCILFFQHTVNAVTRILNTPVSGEAGDSVHEKVGAVVESYGKLKEIKKDAREALDAEDGIAKCKDADKRLWGIEEKLR